MPQTTPRGYPFPCYHDPTDFPDQMQDLAEAVDTDVDNLLTALDAAKARPAVIAAGPNQSIPNSVTGTPVNFTSVSYDTGPFITVPSTSFTAPVAGLYMIAAQFTFNTSDTNMRRISLQQVTPTTPFAASSVIGVADVSTDLFVSAMQFFAAGASFEVIAFQNTGAALQLFSPRLSASLVSV